MGSSVIVFLTISQLYLCDNFWTKEKCKNPEEVISEAVIDNKAPDGTSTKKLLVHDLRMDVIEAMREFKLRSNISAVEALCKKKETSVEACRKAVERKSEALKKKLTSNGR